MLFHVALNAASRTHPSAPPHLKCWGGRSALAGFYGTSTSKTVETRSKTIWIDYIRGSTSRTFRGTSKQITRDTVAISEQSDGNSVTSTSAQHKTRAKLPMLKSRRACKHKFQIRTSSHGENAKRKTKHSGYADKLSVVDRLVGRQMSSRV